MAKVKWDQTGKRLYETGVDRGVVYPQASNGSYPKGAGWNGLTAVTESPSGAEPTPLWANNHKFLTLMSAGEFGATIEAYTYPDEFAECDGSSDLAKGVRIGQQKRKTFGFTYRTKIGNDVDGESYGYRLHLVYGALAAPSEKNRQTINEDPEATTMSWEISTTPVEVDGFEPTSHLEIDSTTADHEKLAALETILYGKDPTTLEGSDGVDPRLPLPDEVATLMGAGA